VKIALVAEPYVPIPPPQYGGIEQVVFYLIKGLKEAGHEPVLLGPADSKVDCEIIPTIDHALAFPRTQREILKHTALVKRTEKTTARRLREIAGELDIIHSHGFDLLPFKKFPNVTTLHNPIEFVHLPYYSKRSDLFYVSISQNYQKSFPGLQYVNHVYNGEDPSEFPLVTQPEDYLCFLGRFDRDKCPHIAIQLALSLGMKIKLAGKIDHKSEGYFEEEIQPYLKHPLVDYLGELGFEEKVDLLAHAKCNLHPTNFREPFGLTVIEAAYCGTPTLATARGSLPELIEDERTGILVEDFIEGFNQIEKCFAMDREYIASRARMLFNYETMSQQYVETYQKVISMMPEYENENVFQRLLHVVRLMP
jgi:glycosyltransferase involved in cell wall biosynthesis